MFSAENNNFQFKILLIIALLAVGVAYSLPHLIRGRELGKLGKPYYAWTQEAQFDMFNVHAARYRAIADGASLSLTFPQGIRGKVRDLFSYDDTAEHRGGPSLWPLLSAAIFAPLLWLVKSVSATVIITDALFPMLIFAAFFWLFSGLTGKRRVALFASFVLMLFPQLPLLLPPSGIAEFKQIIKPLYDLTYLRREAFIPAGAFFILCLHFVHGLIAQARGRWRVAAAGVSYGLLFYFYFYFWSYMTIVLGLLFLAMLAVKRRDAALRLLAAGVIGLLVSALFWLNLYELVRLPQYQELIQRGGLELGRSIRFGLWKTYVLYLGMAGAAVWLGYKIKQVNTSIFVAVLLLSNIVALNAQLIAGFNIQSDHWSGRVFLITVGIGWTAILSYVYKFFQARLARFRTALVALGIIIPIILLANMLYLQLTIEPTQAQNYTVDQNFLAAYDWMNRNLPAGTVVATPALATNTDLPVFTRHKLFMPRAQTTIASEQEIIQRLLFTYKLFGVSPQTFTQLLATPQAVIYFFTARYEDKALDRYLNPERYQSFSLPPRLRESILAQYQELVLPQDLGYQLDYLFVGPAERALGVQESMLSGFPLVYNAGGVQIYKYE